MESQESINKVNNLPDMLELAWYPVTLTEPWESLTTAVRDEIYAVLRWETPDAVALKPKAVPRTEKADTNTWIAKFPGWKLPRLASGYWQVSDAGYVVAVEESALVSDAAALWVRRSFYAMTHGNLVVRATLPQEARYPKASQA